MKLETFEWSDEKVIDFVNWYIKVQKLDFRFTLENQTILDSFKNGDKPSDWEFDSDWEFNLLTKIAK